MQPLLASIFTYNVCQYANTERRKSMIKLYQDGVYLYRGEELFDDPRQCQQATGCAVTPEEAAEATISYGILKAHNTGDDMSALRLKFDSMTSHDITAVGIIQTARASGMTYFPCRMC